MTVSEMSAEWYGKQVVEARQALRVAANKLAAARAEHKQADANLGLALAGLEAAVVGEVTTKRKRGRK
jgi:hypothetical protein